MVMAALFTEPTANGIRNYGIWDMHGLWRCTHCFFYHISLIVLYILQRFRSFSRVLALALAHFAIQIVCA
jgi:hypothetical protein